MFVLTWFPCKWILYPILTKYSTSFCDKVTNWIRNFPHSFHFQEKKRDTTFCPWNKKTDSFFLKRALFQSEPYLYLCLLMKINQGSTKKFTFMKTNEIHVPTNIWIFVCFSFLEYFLGQNDKSNHCAYNILFNKRLNWW